MLVIIEIPITSIYHNENKQRKTFPWKITATNNKA